MLWMPILTLVAFALLSFAAAATLYQSNIPSTHAVLIHAPLPDPSADTNNVQSRQTEDCKRLDITLRVYGLDVCVRATTWARGAKDYHC